MPWYLAVPAVLAALSAAWLAIVSAQIRYRDAPYMAARSRRASARPVKEKASA